MSSVITDWTYSDHEEWQGFYQLTETESGSVLVYQEDMADYPTDVCESAFMDGQLVGFCRHIGQLFGLPASDILKAVRQVPTLDNLESLYYCHHEGQASWWEYDARGIALCKVCQLCKESKLAQYRPEVLVNPDYQADEQIEPDL
jgi:hypothetical protein